MKSFSLFWMVVWAVVFALAIVTIFWRPAVYFLAVIALVFLVLFIHDYREARGV